MPGRTPLQLEDPHAACREEAFRLHAEGGKDGETVSHEAIARSINQRNGCEHDEAWVAAAIRSQAEVSIARAVSLSIEGQATVLHGLEEDIAFHTQMAADPEVDAKERIMARKEVTRLRSLLNRARARLRGPDLSESRGVVL